MVERNPSGEPSVQRRRTTRIVQTVPMTVTGTDALGQPFKERTSALIINCHGCKYQSKHFVMKDSWVNFEIAHPEPGQEPRRARAKVVWVQRPRTVQELFQVAAQLQVPGNLWGVAFPPDDWFAWAGDQAAPAAEIPAPGAAVPQEPPAAPSAPPAVNGKVAVMPAPPPSGEQAAGIERYVHKLLADARLQVQKTAREAAATAVTAETGNLLREVEAQLRAAAKKAIEAVAGPYVDEAVRQALEQFQQKYQADAGAMRDQWTHNIQSQFAAASQQMVSRMEDAGKAVQTDFAQQFHASMDTAAAQLSEIEHRMTELRSEISASAASAQSRFVALSGELDSATARAAQQWRDRLNLQEEESLAHLKDLEAATRTLKDDIAAAAQNEVPQLRAQWREQLEGDMALAGADWNTLVESSIAGATENLTSRFGDMALNHAARTERDLALRIAGLKKSFEESAAEAVRAQTAVRSDLQQHLFNTRDSFDALQAAARSVDQHSAKLEALTRDAAAKLDAQYQNLVAAHTAAIAERSQAHQAELAALAESQKQSMTREGEAQLAGLAQRGEEHLASLHQRSEAHLAEMNRRSDGVLQGMAEQLRPALDQRAAETLARFTSRADRELQPRLESARAACHELAAGELRAEQALFAQTEKLLRASEENIRQAEGRMRDILARLHQDFENLSRVTLEKRIEELDTKSSDTTHTTFEAIFKAAEWYQKKVHTTMEATLSKGVELAASDLRERAAEVSRVFSQELDHFSRTYTEHTQGQLDESAREMVERAREDLSQAHLTQAAAFGDDAHRIAKEKLANFAEESSAVRDDTTAQIEAHAEKVKARWAEHAGRSFTEFQDQIASQMAASLLQAQSDFQASLGPILDQWRLDRAAQHKEWLEKMALSTTEGVEQYRGKLDNVSNTWMFASVTTLNQHSHNVIEALQKTAEQRLRATCSAVLNTLADSMRTQILGISSDLAGPQPPPNGETK